MNKLNLLFWVDVRCMVGGCRKGKSSVGGCRIIPTVVIIGLSQPSLAGDGDELGN